MLAAGSRAPEIDASDLSGSPVFSRDELRRGPILIAFFKVSCPTCQFALPFLQRFADKGLNVIGVSQDNVGATEAFRDRFGLRFALWLDLANSGYRASNAYGIANVPSLFLIGQDGTILQAGAGFAKQDFIDIGNRFNIAPFSEDEKIPEFKPG